MAQSPEEFFTQLCKEAGYDDSQIQATLALVTHDKVKTKLAETIRRSTDDFTAMQGRVKAATDKVTGYDAWYQDAQPKFASTVNELAELKARVNGNGGNPNGNPNPNPQLNFDTSKFISKEDVVAMLGDQANRFSGVLKEGLEVASKHAAMFGEGLDVSAIEKLAVENGLGITAAYERFVKPRVDERNTAAQKKREQEIREEAIRDFASQHQMPVEAVPGHRSFIIETPKEAPKGGTDAELLDLWNKVGGAPSAAKTY